MAHSSLRIRSWVWPQLAWPLHSRSWLGFSGSCAMSLWRSRAASVVPEEVGHGCIVSCSWVWSWRCRGSASASIQEPLQVVGGSHPCCICDVSWMAGINLPRGNQSRARGQCLVLECSVIQPRQKRERAEVWHQRRTCPKQGAGLGEQSLSEVQAAAWLLSVLPMATGSVLPGTLQWAKNCWESFPSKILIWCVKFDAWILLLSDGESESEVAQSCPTLCDPMDYSLPGYSVRGIFQARVLEWGAIAFSRGSSQPRNRTWVSHIVGRCFAVWATTREVLGRDFNSDSLLMRK